MILPHSLPDPLCYLTLSVGMGDGTASSPFSVSFHRINPQTMYRIDALLYTCRFNGSVNGSIETNGHHLNGSNESNGGARRRLGPGLDPKLETRGPSTDPGTQRVIPSTISEVRPGVCYNLHLGTCHNYTCGSPTPPVTASLSPSPPPFIHYRASPTRCIANTLYRQHGVSPTRCIANTVYRPHVYY